MELTRDQVLNIVKSNDWSIQSFNAYPLYVMCAGVESGWLVKAQFGVGYTHFFFFLLNGRASMYYDRQDWENISGRYYEKIKSRGQLEYLIEEYKSAYKKLLDETRYDESRLVKMATPELIGLLKKLCNRLINAVGAAHVIEGITYGSEEKLRGLLRAKGTFTEQEFGLICSPTRPSFLSEAQRELRQIKSLPNGRRSGAIDEFIANYGWIENNYLGRKQFSHADVVHRIDGLEDDSSEANAEEIISQKAKILRRFDLSDQERFIISTIELCFYWQDERKKYILQSIEVLDPVLEKVADKLDLDATDLKSATPREISEANLLDKNFQRQLKKRRTKSVCYSVPGQNFVFTNTDYDFFSENLHSVLGYDAEEVKGLIASPGVVRGRVRVCESISDINKVGVGEILVASMTRPEYLPAMQRAIAFVTDEGGITCHAAIVAREMKKPCVIGTKIATKVFKDGDLVEVDAEKGIVRKI